MNWIIDAKNLIVNGKIKEAIQFVQQNLSWIEIKVDSEIHKTLSLLQMQVNDLEEQSIRFTIEFEKYFYLKNKIAGNLLQLVASIEKKYFNKPLEEVDKANAISRAELITKNLEALVKENKYGIVREKGNFSTFSILNRPINHPVWRGKLNWRNDESEELKRRLIKQRFWLEKHVSYYHCKLIVHLEDGIKFKRTKASLYRLKSLLEFIQTHKDRIDIVNRNGDSNRNYENILIVENPDDINYSFFAKSTKASATGIKDTTIKLDPLKIEDEIARFDEEFEVSLKGMDIYESREHVIKLIKKHIVGLQYKLEYLD